MLPEHPHLGDEGDFLTPKMDYTKRSLRNPEVRGKGVRRKGQGGMGVSPNTVNLALSINPNPCEGGLYASPCQKPFCRK